ncbi:MAG: TetR/AcrR family transcriptional regulator [Acidobacteriota bacterium]
MPRQRRPEVTRQVLIDAAFGEIHRKGFQAASVDEILERTGVTKGALYHHFPSKLDLGYAVVEDRLSKALLQYWLLPLQAEPDPIAALLKTIKTAVAGLTDESVCLGCPIANLAQEMSPVDEGFRERIDRLYRVWQDGVAGLIERGKEIGKVRRDVDARSAAIFIVASIAGTRVIAKSAKDKEVVRQCMENLCAYIEGLRPAKRRNQARRSRV